MKEQHKDKVFEYRGITYKQYKDENDLPLVQSMIDNELSEPYTIFTYRYFVYKCPELCYIAFDKEKPIGTVVGKIEKHRFKNHYRGYVAMLVVDKTYRGKRIGSKLVELIVDGVKAAGGSEVVLEAEVVNAGALRLYQALGFIRDKRLYRYYMNGSDAFRLKLLLKDIKDAEEEETTLGYEPASNMEDLTQEAYELDALTKLIKPPGGPGSAPDLKLAV